MKNRHITFNSPVILSFVIISFGVMVANYLTAGLSNQLLFVTYHSSLASPMTYVRFFTHVLGHLGWSHYINNMMYMLLLGPMLEEKYGSRTIIEVILITGLMAGLAIPLTVIMVAVIFIGQQIYEGLFVQDNISNMAHIVGGIVGAIAGYTLNKKE